MKNYYSIDRLFKNFNVLQVGTDKNPTTPLQSKNLLIQKNIKMTKRGYAVKG